MGTIVLEYDFKRTHSYLSKTKEFLREQVGYFRWALENSHGLSIDNKIEYLMWPADSEAHGNDIIVYKKKDSIAFRHKAPHGGHNIMILTSSILNQSAKEYILNKNKHAEEIIKYYSKGIVATMKGMIFSNDDKERYIMARNIIPESHLETINGKKKWIDYSEWRNEYKAWNAERIHNKNNPFYGDIYVTTIRSKDDLPHLFKTLPALKVVEEITNNIELKESIREMFEYVKGFCRTIIENNYHIPTKNKEGRVTIPKGDLAHILMQEKYARVSISLIADTEIDYYHCGSRIYEKIATMLKYYNYKIFNNFHISAILLSRMKEERELEDRLTLEYYNRLHKLTKNVDSKHGMKSKDLAHLLIQSKEIGIELTPSQDKIIRDETIKAHKEYSRFKRWNLWDKKVPSGIYGSQGGYIPYNPNIMRVEELADILFI